MTPSSTSPVSSAASPSPTDDTLEAGVKIIDGAIGKLAEVAVDEAAEKLSSLIGLLPGGSLASKAFKALTEQPKAGIKAALRESLKLQTGPAAFEDRRIHYPGEQPDPFSDPKLRAELYKLANQLGSATEVIKLSEVPQDASPDVKRNIVRDNLQKIGLEAKDADATVANMSPEQIEHADQCMQQAYQEKPDAAASEAEIRQAWENVKNGLNGLGSLADAVGSKALKTITTLGSAAITITEAVASFSQLGSQIALIGPAAMLGPIGAIAGAAALVIGLFSSGPSATEIMMKQLHALSEQIYQLNKVMVAGFKGVYESQQMIMKALVEGLAEIKSDFNNKLIGLEVMLTASFSALKASVDYLTDQEKLNTANLYIQNLDLARSKAGTSGLSKETAQSVSYDLAAWMADETLAGNALLTGRHITESAARPEAKYLLNLLQNSLRRDDLLCSLTGWLAGEYDARRKTSFNHNMVNALIWYQAATAYIGLQQHYPEFDTDPADSTLEKAISLGTKNSAVLAAIEDDSTFWQGLAQEYNRALSGVLELQKRYIDAYHSAATADYNKAAKAGHIADESCEVAALDFLAKPDDLMQQFAARSIIRVAIQEQFGIKLTAPGRIYDFLKSARARNDYPTALLAAEYLGLIHFSAKPAAAVVYPAIPLSFAGDACQRLFEKMKTRGEVTHPGNSLIGEVGMEFFSDGVTEWTIPLELDIQGSAADGQIASTTVKGSYEQLHVGATIQDETSHESDMHGPMRSYPKYSDPGGDGGYPAKLRAAIPGYIAEQWNGAAAPVSLIDPHIALRTEAISAVNNAVKKAFLAHRRAIAEALIKRAENTSERNVILKAYDEALTKLDTIVIQIKLYAKLLGKDLSQPAVAGLIDAQSIQADIEAEADKLDSHDLTPRLIRARRKALTWQDLQALPSLTMDKLGPSHPKLLLAAATSALKRYGYWKNLTRATQPGLFQYYSMQQYWQEKTSDELRASNYELFEMYQALITDGVSLAQFFINFSEVAPMKPDNFKNFHIAILRWGLQQSKDAIVTGSIRSYQKNWFYQSSGVIKPLPAIISASLPAREDPHEARNYLLKQLQKGWQYNIALLVELAIAWDGSLQRLRHSLPAVETLGNFYYWSESSLTYLQLLEYPHSLQLADAADLGLSPIVQGLKRLIQSGHDFKTIIYSLVFSPGFFAKLFEDYGYFLTALKTKLASETALEAVIYKKISDGDYQYQLIFDQLEVCRLLLLNYISLCFGYNLAASPNTVYLNTLKSPEALKRALACTGEVEKGYIVKQVQQYQSEVSSLKDMVDYTVHQTQGLTLFKYWLGSYFNKGNWPCSVLRIPGELFKHPQHVFSVEHVDLIDQFLAAHPYITAIELFGFPVDSASLDALVACVKKYPRIKALTLGFSAMPTAALLQLSPLLKQLRLLDLRGNELGAEGEAALFEILPAWLLDIATSSLQCLNLAGNALGNAGMAAFAGMAALTARPVSRGGLIIDLSENGVSEDCVRSINESRSADSWLNYAALPTETAYPVTGLPAEFNHNVTILSRPQLGQPKLDYALLHLQETHDALAPLAATVLETDDAGPSAMTAFQVAHTLSLSAPYTAANTLLSGEAQP